MCTYNDIQKESYKITNINVWQLFPIHLTFSYQNRQFSIVIVVNVFSWIDFKIYYDFIYFIYRSIIQTVFRIVFCLKCDIFYNLFLFETICAISAYHHWSYEFQSRSWWGVLDTTLCDNVCQCFATDRWFSPVSSNKTDRHDITELLLNVILNTIFSH